VLRDVATRDLAEEKLRAALGGQETTTVRGISDGDLVEAIVPIWAGSERRVIGTVAVAMHVSERLESKVRLISDAFKEYKQLRLLKNPIKFVYILLFLLMSLIVVFSFTWFGLYLARGITDPVEQLVQGTREVAAGNVGYKVQVRADDEIGALVASFNRMTDDLSESKHRLEEAYLDLQDKHTELEERRRYIETVLEAITTGVISFDPLGRVTTINRAAARMFGLEEDRSVGRLVEDVFAGPDRSEVVALLRRTRRPKGGAADGAPAPRHRRRVRGRGGRVRRPDGAPQGAAGS
jgi:two-component system, NtrC family, nitrogen regulation sensor histidine kinase NtrY